MKKTLFYIILLTALIKFIAVFFLCDYCKLWEDYDMAQNLYNFGELKYFHNGQWNYNYNFPVYPFCLNLIFYVFGNTIIPVLIFNIILHSIAVWMFFSVTQSFLFLFNHLIWLNNNKTIIAFVSSLFFLLHPLINYYALINIHPFIMNQFFIIGALFFMFKYIDNQNLLRMIMYACFLGIGFIDRSTLCVVTLPFVMLIVNSNSLLVSIKKIAMVAFISLLPAMFWMARNYSVANHFALTSSFGENMWLGVQEQTEGTTQLANSKSYYQLLKSDIKKIPKLTATQQNNYFLKLYNSVLNQQPSHVIKMFFIKLKNFWFFRSHLGIDYNQSIKKFIPVYKVFYLTALFLAIFVSFSIGKKTLIFWSFLIVLSLLQAMVYVETRHRIIIEPFIIMFAVIALYYIKTHFYKNQFRFKTI